MNKQPNRKAIWISAAITLLMMGLASRVIFGPTRLSASGREALTATVAPRQTEVVQKTAPSGIETAATDADTQALIAEYQAKLDQAYQVLQDAYSQIQLLQQAQGQGQGRFRSEDGFREREHERRTAPFSDAGTQERFEND